MTKRVSEGKVLERNQRVVIELTALRDFVDNFNVNQKIALRASDTYQQLKDTDIFTTRMDGWIFGYALEEYPTFFKRKVYVKVLEAKLSEVPEPECRAVVTAAFEACLDIGQGECAVEMISPDCLLITQEFSPVFLQERTPGVVVPGGSGRP